VSEYSEAEQMERAKSWLKANGIWIIAGIAIGAGGLGGWRWYQERREHQAETASARYEELVDAFSRRDNVRGTTLLEELNREYAWTPYASLGTLIAARVQVEANELDKAAAGLKSVMDNAKDDELKMVARLRLAACNRPSANTMKPSRPSRSTIRANSRHALRIRVATCCSPRATVTARCASTSPRAVRKTTGASTSSCSI